MKTWAAIALSAIPALALDRWTKAWVVDALPLGAVKPYGPFFNLVHYQNRGVAFGMFAGQGLRWLMIAGALIGLFVLLIWTLKTARKSAWAGWGLGLALGGAVGNLIDRISLGYVTDFIELHYQGLAWPAFNVADSALTVGFGIIAIVLIRKG